MDTLSINLRLINLICINEMKLFKFSNSFSVHTVYLNIVSSHFLFDLIFSCYFNHLFNILLLEYYFKIVISLGTSKIIDKRS